MATMADDNFTMFDIMDRNARAMGTLPPRRKRRKQRVNKSAKNEKPSQEKSKP